MKWDYYGKKISPNYLITGNQPYRNFRIWKRKLVKSSVLAEKYKNTIQEHLDRGNT